METINTISIRSKIQKAAQGKRFEGLARSAANTRLIFAKLALVKAIDDDIVAFKDISRGVQKIQRLLKRI